MRFMTPAEYFRLLYKSFFKAITLTEESEGWDKKKKILIILQAGVYNFFVCLIISFSILFLLKLVSILLPFEFNFYNDTLINIFVTVFFGVVVGVFVGVFVVVVVGEMNILNIFYSTAIFEFCYFLFSGRLFYYPFYLPGLFKKINLQKIPFHWDENIALPVPFLPGILVKQAEYNKKAAVNEAVYLIRNRPIHRKRAQKGLVIIALNEMKSFRTLENIAHLKKELSFLPLSEKGFSETLGKSFRKNVFAVDFDTPFQTIREIEKDARIAWDEHNPSGKLRLLRRLVSRIEDFQKQLDFSRSGYSSHFSDIASKWLHILREHITGLEKTSGKPLPNPFITGNPIRPEDSELFVGRMDIIKEIEKEVLKTGSPGALLFLGNRRTGKTSALLNMGPHLVSGITPVFIDFQDPLINSSIKDFSTEMGRRISKALKGPKKPPVTCNTLADLTRFMQQLQIQLEGMKGLLLLCFDEFERIPGKMNELVTLPDTFRYWIQHLKNIICLFAGSHKVNEISKVNWSDYLINVRVIPISFLDFDSALKLVTKPVPEYDIFYNPPDLAGKLVYRLGRHPYLIQLTMSQLTELLNHKNSRTAAQEDINAAVREMFVAASGHFRYFWDTELNQDERELVSTLAHSKKLPALPGITVKSLVRKKVLHKDNDDQTFPRDLKAILSSL